MYDNNAQATKVEYRKKPNFFERLGKSCSGLLIGFLMFLFSFVILYYNEGLSVETMIVIKEASKEVVPLDRLDKYAFDKKLVHHNGELQIEQDNVDPMYNLQIKCVKLLRKVEMYQWVEHSDVKEYDEGDKVRRETTYSYSTEWRSDLVSSRNFDEEVGHRNPLEMLVKDATYTLDSVYVDGVLLSPSMVDKINWFQTLYSLPKPKESLKVSQNLHYYYHGNNPNYPQVGDTRVHFRCAGVPQGASWAPTDKISVIAMLRGNSFAPYKIQSGKYVEYMYHGVKTAGEIFNAEYSYNTTRTWFLRFFGFILMFIGLSIMSKIVVTLVDWIPIVREIVSLSVTLFNLSTSICLSLITIAISWVRFRPLLASALFSIAFLPWIVSRQRARSYLSR